MASMVRKLCQIGNSQGLILPRTLLEMLGWTSDSEIELKIVPDPHSRLRSKLVLSAADRGRELTHEEARQASDKVFKKHRQLIEKLSRS